MVGGIFDILPILGLPLYPGTVIGNVIFCLLTTMTIAKHNLLDIRIVLRKGVAYLIAAILFVLPFVVVFLVVTSVSAGGKLLWWTSLALLILLALSMSTLWNMIQQWIDRWFFRERYSFLKALDTFRRGTQSLVDSAVITESSVKLLAGAFGTKMSHLLESVGTEGDFVTTFSTGVSGSGHSIHLSKRSPLVKWLSHSDEALAYEEIDNTPQLQVISEREREDLQRVNAKLIIPLKARGHELYGILVLSAKHSGQPYTLEDRQLASSLSSQLAVKLENAKLYNDTEKARENLESWLDSMSDCVIIVNTDYVIQFVNKAARDGFNTRRDKNMQGS